MLIEHHVAPARADKNEKKDIPWISVSAVGMFEGCLADIQRIAPMSEVDICWTSPELCWTDLCYVGSRHFLSFSVCPCLFVL